MRIHPTCLGRLAAIAMLVSLVVLSTSCKSKGRPKGTEAFVNHVIELFRTGDFKGWVELQMSRKEYESRCRSFLEEAGPTWLDDKMARQRKRFDGAIERCEDLQSSPPLKVLWIAGGEKDEKYRSKCEDYEAREPLELIVENARKKRFSVRIDVQFDTRNQVFIPDGYVECFDALPGMFACERFARFLEDDPTMENTYFSSYDCRKQLESEGWFNVGDTLACLEKAADLPAAKACWKDRPLGERPW